MSSNLLRVGGVPEHFNYPWHSALKKGKFSDAGLEIEWISYPGGTGAMTAALREGTCDVCMVLTEGIIADIMKGNPSRIISGYVQTPLIWGIHTSADVSITPDEIFNKRIAISRRGSGSHLMPVVHALNEGKKLKESQFIVVGDIDGALVSLQSHETDIFYWEKFTTKPYVDKGKLKRIDEFVTPWPCFMIVATDRIIESEPEALDSMLKIIHSECADFMNQSNAPQIISDEYGIGLTDAIHWFHATEWFTHSWVSDKMLTSVGYTLIEAGIIEGLEESVPLVWKRQKS